MSAIKTIPTDISATDFIATIPDELKRNDGLALLKLFEEVTGEKPKMWGTSIVGYGQYHYKSERSNQEGDWPLAGFSPRKQALTLYLTMSFSGCQELLEGLGKHKTSGGCLYIKKLADVNLAILAKVIEGSFQEMKKRHA
jgi:Domain of unknown function (DU1801)